MTRKIFRYILDDDFRPVVYISARVWCTNAKNKYNLFATYINGSECEVLAIKITFRSDNSSPVYRAHRWIAKNGRVQSTFSL